jgi:hypothetical protein
MFGTDCPASHPVRLPLIFMETVWDTKPFNDPGMWPTDGSQPLVWSMGDPCVSHPLGRRGRFEPMIIVPGMGIMPTTCSVGKATPSPVR